MKHNDYFVSIEPSTSDDAREYVFSALRMIPEEWQGYEVTFSQYGLAKMLVDLGHARLEGDGTIIIQTTAGHRVIFAKWCPVIGIVATTLHTIPRYAVIVPTGIVIDNTVYEIK